MVQGLYVGLAVGRPFHQTAVVLCSDQAFRFVFFLLQCFFGFNFLINCKCQSLWELADFVSFPAVSGTAVIFVVCI